MDESLIQFLIVQEWPSDEIVDLYRAAGWWKDEYDPSEIPRLMRGSYIFVVGIDRSSGKAVAMGRILSDNVKTGYIQDLCVHTDMRGQKIGKALLNYLVQSGMNAGLKYLFLIAEPDTNSFYERAGFIQIRSTTFLKVCTG